MSQENVNRFLASAEAAGHGDVEGVIRVMDPDIEFIPQRAPVQGSYRGHEAVRGFFKDTAETFEVFEPRYPDVRDLGDRFLAIGTIRIRGKGSGIDTEVPSAILVRVKVGLITYLKDFGDVQKALEAAGLQEGGG
jgi:ketosteroid isomerase-like protein